MAKCYYINPELDFNISSVSKSFWIVNNSNKKNENIIRKLFSRHPSIKNRVKKLMTLRI